MQATFEKNNVNDKNITAIIMSSYRFFTLLNLCMNSMKRFQDIFFYLLAECKTTSAYKPHGKNADILEMFHANYLGSYIIIYTPPHSSKESQTSKLEGQLIYLKYGSASLSAWQTC